MDIYLCRHETGMLCISYVHVVGAITDEAERELAKIKTALLVCNGLVNARSLMSGNDVRGTALKGSRA
jgi:hypothetical protein